MDFYQTPAHPCGYLPNRFSVNIFADPNIEFTTRTYSRLIDYGFRRNGKQLYRPQCPHCSACVPTRVCVNEFKPSRSQQRTLRMNQDLEVRTQPGNFYQEHYNLYTQYICSRHIDSPMGQSTEEDYKTFILGTWSNTKFLEFYLNKKLVSTAVFDVLPQGLSAVYCYYDVDYSRRGLGNLAILKLIEKAADTKLPYLYLGYWIKECQKMSYKNKFRPIEGYINNTWQLLSSN